MSELSDDPCGELPALSGTSSAQHGPCHLPPPSIDGYQVREKLGEAGQGQVWRAVQLGTHREVALKVPRLEVVGSRKSLARFEREIELAARLNHPNIARIYDSGMHQGLYYYTMELIEGMPLDRYVQHHTLSIRETMEVMQAVCGAVQHAHQNGVIHRDIKPSNILVAEDRQPYVVDFGLAMTLVEDGTFKTVATDGGLAGTPAYMSPEQAAGDHEHLDTRTDVYSLGIVLFELLTGHFPYEVKTSMAQTLQNIMESRPAKPSRILRGLDPDIDAIILKALAKTPDDRYQSAAQLRHDIRCWLAGRPIVARSHSLLYLLRKIMANYRYTSAVAALMLLTAVGFSCFSLELFSEIRRINLRLGRVLVLLGPETEGPGDRVREAGFQRLLTLWHDGAPDLVADMASSLGVNNREALAAQFLLDPRPLDEKEPAFRQQLEVKFPHFVAFILAEHHLRDGNEEQAARSYRKCLSDVTLPEHDDWLATCAKCRLYDLRVEDRHEVDSDPDQSKGKP